MIYRILLYLLIFQFPGFTLINAQEIRRIDDTKIQTSELTSTIEKLMLDGNVHGLTISIVTRDSVLLQKAFGYNELSSGKTLSVKDNFYAASFSKVVFAYIVMSLVQEGKMDLDKPLVEYLHKPLTDYQFSQPYEGYQDLISDDRHKLITARMCLSHSSGLPNWRYIGKFGINKKKPLKIEFEPGTFYSYSGEGIFLLQFVVEEITGKDLEDLAKEYVFGPFNMNMTSFNWQDRFNDNYASGHTNKGKVLSRNKRTTSNAAGSMDTTPEDYARFIQAMLQRVGLEEKYFEEMFSPQIQITSKQQFGKNHWIRTDENLKIKLSYGLGWGLYQTPHGKAVFKEGHINGWEHYCIIYPENNLGLIIMTNSSNGESIFRSLLIEATGDRWMPWYWEGFYPYNLKTMNQK